MKIIQINAQTGEEILRDMTTDELEISERDKIADAEKQKKLELKKIERTALLNKLGISDNEAKLLLS